MGQGKDHPCGYDGGNLPPFLLEQGKLPGENMSMFEREKGNEAGQHCWMAKGWCCKGVIAGRATETACTARDPVAL